MSVSIGEVFGDWVVVSFGSRGAGHKLRVVCSCVCGVVREVDAYSLKSGGTKSCGCTGRGKTAESRTTHGMSRKGAVTRTYRAWQNMKRRCYDESHVSYHRYGAKGVVVTPEWLNSFENFLEDMGECPDGKTLDRKDSSGNYEPGNCRWATDKEQVDNRGNTIMVVYGGDEIPLADAARKAGLKYATAYRRYKVKGHI